VTGERLPLALSSQQYKDTGAGKYQEKGHHSGDNKQQEFTEEVWFHQLISTHGPHPISIADLLSTGQKIRSSNTLNSRPSAGEWKAGN
jgi:hypothetical protein